MQMAKASAWLMGRPSLHMGGGQMSGPTPMRGPDPMMQQAESAWSWTWTEPWSGGGPWSDWGNTWMAAERFAGLMGGQAQFSDRMGGPAQMRAQAPFPGAWWGAGSPAEMARSAQMGGPAFMPPYWYWMHSAVPPGGEQMGGQMGGPAQMMPQTARMMPQAAPMESQAAIPWWGWTWGRHWMVAGPMGSPTQMAGPPQMSGRMGIPVQMARMAPMGGPGQMMPQEARPIWEWREGWGWSDPNW
jgi:hypothetical protein